MIDLPLALSSWGTEEIEAIQRVIKSDQYSMANEVKTFEIEFSKYMGSKYSVMVNSGSSANLLAIASLFYGKKPKLKAGDEVIVPAVSWPTTYYPLYQYGLKLKFVDIDKKTLNLDLSLLEDAITSNTKAIFCVNLLGNPIDYIQLNKILENKNIFYLEDNCESLGAKLENKLAGSFGLLGTHSFFFSHHMSTMEGGMVSTDDEELYQILLSMRAHGWTRNLPETNLLTGQKSSNWFEESFNFILPGYNLRPIEMSGAIGKEQLKKLDAFISVRRKNAMEFQNLFKNHPFLTIQKEVGESSWFGFSFIVKEDSKLTRDMVLQKLKDVNVEYRPIVAGNFAKNTVVKKYFNYEIHGDLKNANTIDSHGFFIGNHHVLKKDELIKLREILN